MDMVSHGQWLPTIEFGTQDKCVAVGDAIKKDIEQHQSFISGISVFRLKSDRPAPT